MQAAESILSSTLSFLFRASDHESYNTSYQWLLIAGPKEMENPKEMLIMIENNRQEGVQC